MILKYMILKGDDALNLFLAGGIRIPILTVKRKK
jgi:hypothetical protein